MPVYKIKTIAQADGKTDNHVSLMMPLEYNRGHIVNGEYHEKRYAVADLRSYSQAEHKMADTLVTLLLQQAETIKAIEDSTISSSLPPQVLLGYHKFFELRTDVPVRVEYRSEYAYFQNENILASKQINDDVFVKLQKFLDKEPKIAFFFQRFSVIHEMKQQMLAESSAFMLANFIADKSNYSKKEEPKAEEPTKTINQSLDEYVEKRKQMFKEQAQKYFYTSTEVFIGKDGNHYPPLWINYDMSDKLFKEVKLWHLNLLNFGFDAIDKELVRNKIKEKHFELTNHLFDTVEEKEQYKSDTIQLWQAQQELWQVHSEIMKRCEKKNDALFYTFGLPNLVKQKTNCSKEIQQLVKEFGVDVLNKNNKESLHNFIFGILQNQFMQNAANDLPIHIVTIGEEEEKKEVEAITAELAERIGDRCPFEINDITDIADLENLL